ncbi:MAG: polyprenyl synthetase family protein, partial [Actinomycetota bacterium]|nr:polyprenyl synthetase family protein [Actinomycetota bacterium]
LYHDDVIDDAGLRHGTASVNTNWGNTAAILAGDFLMARASEVAAASLGLDSVVLLARTYAELCEGQVLELQLVDDLAQDPADYHRAISRKTASLIRTSARLGAMAADASPGVVEAASRWASEIGVVFQLTDDVLDLVATEEFLGKPVHSDVQEGKFTLPVLYAMTGPNGERLRSLLAGGHPYPAERLDAVMEAVKSSGTIERVMAEARQRVRSAEAAAAALPPAPARDVLMEVGRYLIGRVDQAGG